MDVKQLRYFLGVIEAGSLSKAAGLLHVAQPALGVHIRNLERELGVKLLERHARGVAPTKAGELLARRAKSLLHEFSRIRQEMLDFGAVPSGRVVLGLTSTVAQLVVAKFAERCRQKYPEVHLVITRASGNELIEQVAREEIDIGLAFRPHDNDEIISEALVHDELVLVQSTKISGDVDFRTIIASELILPSESHLVRRIVKRAAAAIGMELNVFYDADSIAMIKELVKLGLGPTILPITAVYEEVQDGKLFCAPIKNVDFVRTLFLLQPARRFPSKSIDLIRDELRLLISEFALAGSVGWRPANSSLVKFRQTAGDKVRRGSAL
jgi:LysR family transcriptional regulator, nitrogen assimilation regulatory protein